MSAAGFRPTPFGLPQTLECFEVDDAWPLVDERVMVWGDGPARFGYRDRHGQWRRVNHNPMNSVPTCWAPVPNPVVDAAAAALRGDPVAICFSMHDYLWRMREWSEQIFGPGPRVTMVLDHIRKEIVEVEEAPGDLREWLDVVTLALDGAWRAGFSPSQIIQGLLDLQARNKNRQWPDWRTHDPDKAIEHVQTANGGGR